MFSIIARGRLCTMRAVGIAIGQAPDVLERPALGDFLAGVVEFLAAHEVDRGGGLQRAVRIDHGLGADHADAAPADCLP